MSLRDFYGFDDIVAQMARPGQTAKQLTDRLHFLHRQNHIHTFGNRDRKGGKTARHLFPADQVVAAMILGRLIDCGIADQQIFYISSTAMTAWRRDEIESFREEYPGMETGRPLELAIKACDLGLKPFFALHIFRDSYGARHVQAQVVATGNPLDQRRSNLPTLETSITVTIDDIVSTMHRDRSREN
jgi:hypothetical protein